MLQYSMVEVTFDGLKFLVGPIAICTCLDVPDMRLLCS